MTQLTNRYYEVAFEKESKKKDEAEEFVLEIERKNGSGKRERGLVLFPPALLLPLPPSLFSSFAPAFVSISRTVIERTKIEREKK